MAESVITLRVIEEYHNRGTDYEKGQKITVSAETAEWLLADAPGCFARADKFFELPEPPEMKNMMGPAKDKMVHKAKNK
jgi:hypothetical protein